VERLIVMKLSIVLIGGLVTAFILGTAHGQDNAASSAAEPGRGEAVFTHWCATCHGEGPGMPGTQALQAKYNGSLPAVLTQRTDLTPELVSFYVRNGISVMPFFRKTEVSDADLEALARYVTDNDR
jgi:mono/diheme cytochrome c family protein